MWTRIAAIMTVSLLTITLLAASPAAADSSKSAIIVQIDEGSPRCYIQFEWTIHSLTSPSVEEPVYWIENNGLGPGTNDVPYGVPEATETGIDPIGDSIDTANTLLQGAANGGSVSTGLQIGLTNIGTPTNPIVVESDKELTPDEFATTCLA